MKVQYKLPALLQTYKKKMRQLNNKSLYSLLSCRIFTLSK